ncbi:YdbH domain-containing protein [Pseudomonas stutzeri]|nr:YdbH domain-containing protein [Stutzerimonas stutzeri]
MAARPRRWPRALGWSLLALLLAALAASGYAWQLWQRVQDAQGIVGLDWRDLEVSRHGLRLERLQFEHLAADGRRLQLQAESLQLDWQLQQRPRQLLRLHVERLQLDWQAPTAPTGRASRLPGADELAGLLGWLPRELQVRLIDARLPCPQAACRLHGSLTLRQPGAALLPASLELALQEGEHRLRLDGALDGHPDDARLELSLRLDEQPYLSVAARLARTEGVSSLHGSLQLPARPPAPWLRQWLEPMFGAAAVQPLARLPERLQVDAEWSLQLPADWRIQAGLPTQALVEQARVQASLPRLQLEPLDLHEIHATLVLRGHWRERELQLELAEGSRLAARRLDAADGLRLDAPNAVPTGLRLRRSDDGSLQLTGPLALAASRLQHTQLRPQGWRWRGRLDATPPAIRLDGLLDNDAGLGLSVQLQRGSDGSLAVQGRLTALELAAGNPLAASLNAWPALLELSAGRLSATASLRLPAGSAPRGAFAMQLDDAAGIYDRSELDGLHGRLLGELHGAELDLELPALRLARLNPGIPLGPLQLRASYQTTLDAPLAGRLQLWQADGGLLGGRLHADPVRLDLARPPQRLVLQLRDLELAELLGVYPAEGLSGSGVVDGRLPLRLDAAGLHVEQGRLAARAPGGVLQLRSERIRAFARSNPALQLAVTALEDFRYDRLESEVSYAPEGQLLLALRLHGHNPALEGGRPVNLAINLEENLPSLLTSLQLSGRVNEAIQRRVQQRLPPRP